ncbi:AAA family ATPase [Caenimonas koreensis]|uniref:Cytidylate kinase n=1 Tax=Caenimonas koreensis DSM 17982 TaxID=1121255 RepID=A0A844APT0_9BURK|nr:cytidylate kinase-like family protein [Caenimonas koreensis]MRD46115.1 hypothetical protein [Caenimonas koreensis DSM 17982]
MTARVICISRALYTDAQGVAAEVAKELGYRIVDEEIVAKAAELRKVAPQEVASVETRKSFLSSLVNEISSSSADVFNYILNPKAAGAGDDMRQWIRQAILETAEEGNVIILAHAASYALARRKDVLRVLITGSEFGRVHNWLPTAGGKSRHEAAEEIRASDAARADYLKRFYDVKTETPDHYDLTVSMDTLKAPAVAALIVQAATSIE